jgi:hypothetical protein
MILSIRTCYVHEHETGYGTTLLAFSRPKGEDVTMEITSDKFVLFTQPG